MNSFEGVEKAAAAHEARGAVVGQHRHPSSRTDEVEAALMHYLTIEQYREREKSSHSADDDERQGSGESS